MVNEIQLQTTEAVDSINSGTIIVEDGRGMVYKSGEAFKDIVQYVHNIGNKSDSAIKAMVMVDERTKTMTESIREIDDIAVQASSSVQNVAASVEEQSASNEEITSSAQLLSEMANDLRVEISKFKIWFFRKTIITLIELIVFFYFPFITAIDYYVSKKAVFSHS